MPTLSNFLGGLHIPRYFGAAIPNNALLVADNIEYDARAGGLRGRRGRSLYATLPAKVTSLWRHYPKTGSPAFLAQVDTGSNSTIYHDTASSGTFTAVTGGGSYATGKRFFYTNWASKDRSFFANGQVLLSYNGVITSVTQTGGQITGPYIVVHQSRLFGTRFDEINYSVYATDVNDELTISSQSQLNVSDPQGGSITGLASLPDRLLIAKSTNIWTMLGDIRFTPILTKFSEVGNVAPLSWQPSVYGVFYVARDGVYITDGVNPVPLYLSAAIEPAFTSATGNTVYPNAVGIWYPRKEQYHLKLDPSHGHSYVLHRLLVPGQNKPVWAWSVNTLAPQECGAVWDSEGDSGDPYFADAINHIYHIDNGATDAGVPYTSAAQTASLRLDADQRVGRVHYVFLNYQGTGAASVGLRYNNAASNDVALSLGVAGALGLQRTRQKVNDQEKSGQFVSAKVTLPADGPSAELYSIGLDARLRSGRIWR
jgi:hypothetical protein